MSSAKHPGLKLTPAESRVATCVLRGLTNEEIGMELGIKHTTVVWHIAAIAGKLGLEKTSRTKIILILSGHAPEPERKDVPSE